MPNDNAIALTEAAILSVYRALESHSKRLGLTGRTLMSEPLAAPGTGLSLAWVTGPIGPAPSGLAATSLVWRWIARLYLPWAEKAGGYPLDVKLDAAAITLMWSLAGDIDLTGADVPEGLIRQVDVLGATAEPLWLDMSGTKYRIRDVGIAITINDAYEQEVA
jgi:hypothetical protein